MTQPPPEQPTDQPPAGLPPFEPPAPGLMSEDEEENAITFGLGLLVREAAAVEYVLHALAVSFAGASRAYEHKPKASASSYIDACRMSLAAMSDDHHVPAAARAALTRDLDRCTKLLDDRNRCVHGYWIYNDEAHTWLTLRGVKDRFPEVVDTDSGQVWQLAAQFKLLGTTLVNWHATYYGEPGDPDEGQPDRISVKHI